MAQICVLRLHLVKDLRQKQELDPMSLSLSLIKSENHLPGAYLRITKKFMKFNFANGGLCLEIRKHVSEQHLRGVDAEGSALKR